MVRNTTDTASTTQDRIKFTHIEAAPIHACTVGKPSEFLFLYNNSNNKCNEIQRFSFPKA